MNWIFNRFGKLWPIMIIGAMIFAFIISATKQDNLDVYTNGSSTYTVEEEEDEKEDLVTNTYMNSTIDLSMQIPDGWQHITKDGYDTYVHSASASSIQIQVMSYYPMVNNATEDSLSETYTERGMTITEFKYLSDNSYYLIYQSQGVSGVTDYIEYVLWDRSHVAKIVVTFNDGNYEKLKDEIWNSLDSISWNYEDPITDGYILNYQLNGDFEFAIPDTWTTGSSDSSLYAYEESSGASLTVNLIEDTTLLSDITELDYSSFLSNGKSDFILNQFQQTDTNIYGEATYTNNNVQTAIIQEYYANGTYQYILTYEYPVSLGSDYATIAQNGLNMTRIFYSSDSADTATTDSQSSEDTSESQSDSQSATSSSSVYVPDTLTSNESSESTESETQTQSETDNSTSSSTGQEEVSTFAEALVSTANITTDAANNIVSVWESLGLGTPTYAQAVKQSDTNLIVKITNDQNTDYYAFINNDGSLQTITINSEDGDAVYTAS